MEAYEEGFADRVLRARLLRRKVARRLTLEQRNYIEEIEAAVVSCAIRRPFRLCRVEEEMTLPAGMIVTALELQDAVSLRRAAMFN